MRVAQALLACTAVVMLVACGVSRAPLPPSLHLPRPVQDLEVSRKGDKVTLTWTVPQHSTDDELLRRHLGVTRVCRQIAGKVTACSQPIAELTPDQLPQPQSTDDGKTLPAKATFTESLSNELQQQNADGVATYAVEVLNTNGRSAGLSKVVEIPLAPIPEPPSQVVTQMWPESVLLRIDLFAIPTDGGPINLGEGPEAGKNVSNFRISRSLKGTNSFTALGFPFGKNRELIFEDRSFEWETTYEYKVTPVTWTAKGVELEGEDSAAVEVFTHDSFAPGTPTGLQAVSSGTSPEKFIDLTWAPNTESDLAGYNVYRRQNEGSPVKINSEVITTPSFRDDNVVPGTTYFYAVTAVDMRRNESSLSAEASEVVP
ncbi:MAG: fibronectin type III domain-containing protein [Acidobacteriales bacterium]|nr:fibronectin type III domain-containing protein [Terriglobales bacterium]